MSCVFRRLFFYPSFSSRKQQKQQQHRRTHSPTPRHRHLQASETMMSSSERERRLTRLREFLSSPQFLSPEYPGVVAPNPESTNVEDVVTSRASSISSTSTNRTLVGTPGTSQGAASDDAPSPRTSYVSPFGQPNSIPARVNLPVIGVMNGRTLVINRPNTVSLQMHSPVREDSTRYHQDFIVDRNAVLREAMDYVLWLWQIPNDVAIFSTERRAVGYEGMVVATDRVQDVSIFYNLIYFPRVF